MKVTPVADRAQIQQTTSNVAGAKARAIAAFSNPEASPAAQPAPDRNARPPGNEIVQNQNAVGVEES